MKKRNRTSKKKKRFLMHQDIKKENEKEFNIWEWLVYSNGKYGAKSGTHS